MMKTKLEITLYMSEAAMLLTAHSPEASEGLSVVAETSAFTLVQGEVTIDAAKRPIPYTLAIPEEVRHETVAIIGSGFGAVKRTSRGLRNALAAQEGLITASYDPARLHSSKKDTLKHFTNPQALHHDTIEAIARDLGSNARFGQIKHADKIADSNLTLIAHSMGGMPVSEFAAANHEIIDQVIYLGSIGMQDALGLKVVPRAEAALRRDILPGILRGQFGYNPKLALQSARYFLSNPLRTGSEIISCAQADIRQNVLYLLRNEVHQSAICPENDAFFYPDETEFGIGYAMNKFIIMKDSDHTVPQKYPLRTAHEIGRLLIT